MDNNYLQSYKSMGKYTLPPVCGNSSLYLPKFSIVTPYLLSIGITHINFRGNII